MSLWGSISGALMSIPIGAARLYQTISNRYVGALFSQAAAGQQLNGKVLVTEQTALTISAVWAAVRVISGSIGVLPLHVFKRMPDGSKLEAGDDVPGADLPGNPNSEMTAITFWETILASALINGNGYAEIERNGLGEPIGLWPIPPNRIRPKRTNKEIVYEALDERGELVSLPSKDVFHVPGLGYDGLRGYSAIEVARRSLGLAATSEQAGETFYAEGMRPSGVIEFPGSLQDLQRMNLKENLKKDHGGAGNFGKNLVLFGGMKYNPLAISPNDAQFLETRAFQIVEIARWFNIPPHMLRDLTRATFSNIEQQSIDFVTHTLLYWLTKITQEFNRKVLAGQKEYYAEHRTEALLKGDTIARYTAYGLGRQWGFLSVNDIRKKENESPIDGGDQYLVPVNMTPANADTPKTPAMPANPTTPPKPPKRAEAFDSVGAYIRRMNGAESSELMSRGKDSKAFTQWIDSEFGANRKFQLMGGLHTAGIDFLSAYQFASKVTDKRRDDLNRLADAVTPKDLPEAACDLAMIWADEERQLIEEARSLIQ